jgi:hypothetical protein
MFMIILMYEQHQPHPPVATALEASLAWYIQSHDFFRMTAQAHRSGRRMASRRIHKNLDDDDDDDDDDDERRSQERPPTHMDEGPSQGQGYQFPAGFPHEYFNSYWDKLNRYTTKVDDMSSEFDLLRRENEDIKRENEKRIVENVAIWKRMDYMEHAFQKMKVFIKFVVNKVLS